MLVPLVALPALADTCAALRVAVSALNVRTGAGTGYAIAGVANTGETYVTTGRSAGDWREIYFDAGSRWVYAIGSYASPVSVACGTVQTAVLNVRSGPSTAYRIVGEVTNGTRWAVLAANGAWRQIWYASEARWVHGDYLNQQTQIPNIEIASVSINNGATSTSSRFVSVSAVYRTSSPTSYRISEDAAFAGASWQNFTTSISFTLSAGSATKRVYLQVRNAQGRLSNVASDTIVYNEPPPQGFLVDRPSFFNQFRANFGAMNQSQVDGLNYLLANMEKDDRPAINNQTVWMRQIAYIFSTVKHEVANTYQPITEYSNTHCVNYDGGCLYKGRGYVQLTHRYNYQKMSPVVGVDLVAYPARALEPNIAYTVMSYGMYNGSFTGRKLGDYVYAGFTDYYNARRVVNGTDRASLLAGYAGTFQTIMESATRRK